MFVVMFDDEQGMCCPYGWSPDCEGAIQNSCGGDVALFESRSAARSAIRISTAYARLRIAQGQIADTDFTDSPGFIKIRPATTKPEATR